MSTTTNNTAGEEADSSNSIPSGRWSGGSEQLEASDRSSGSSTSVVSDPINTESTSSSHNVDVPLVNNNTDVGGSWLI